MDTLPARLAFLITFAAPISLLPAQDEGAVEELVSGPSPGTALTAVICYATDGPRAGKEFDAAGVLGKGPAAVLFIHELTRNTAPVIRGLDQLAQEHAILGFRSFTVLLSGDRTGGEEQLQRVNGSLRLANPLVLSIDGAEGPGNYALNRRSALTLVTAREGKVVRSMALVDTGPNDLPRIRKAVEEVAGALPADEESLRKLVGERLPADAEALRALATDQALELRRLREQLTRMRQQPRRSAMNRGQQGRMQPERPAQPSRQDGPAPQRRGKPPEDAQLNTLLRSFIRQTNDDTRTDEVYADIRKRAAESDDLRTETVEMFKLMLSFPDRYGTKHAQTLAKEFLTEHGAKDE